MGPVGSRICKTVLGERTETSMVKYADLGQLTDPERKLVSLIGCYYYDLLPRIEPECEKGGTCLAIGDGPSEIFTKLRTRLIEEIGKPASGPLDPDAMTSGFLLSVVSHLVDYIGESNDHTTQVLEFHHPREMRNLIGGMLEINQQPQSLDQIVKDCQQTLRYCVRTGHPRFFNQISQGLDIVGLAGQWLTAVANADTYSYEVSPVFTLMEDVILCKMREYIGWKSGQGDGILTPGGTMSTLYAVAVARQRVAPHYKTQGMAGMDRLVMFTSDQSHFSVKSAGILLGIGSDNVVSVDSDQRGKMIISDLVSKIEEALAAGATPFLVSVTAGTTVLGSFDPIEAAADVCDRYHLWLHVDAAWGGGLLLSRSHRSLLNGIHRADSVTWNPHKLMCTPLQCSAILTKEKGVLEACYSLIDCCDLDDPKSLWDATCSTTENKTLQWGRHNDVIKVWLMWRAKGHLEYERQVDRLMELSRYMQEEIERRSGFEFVMDKPEFLNICFWYVPKEMRQLPPGKDRDEKLGRVAPKIKAHMMNGGGTMIGYQPLGHHPNFFRMIISNPATVEGDIDYLLDEIEAFGEM